MMNPKISIIIPVFNTEKYIGRCIESIQLQTFQDYEVIVVDDCSPDNAMKIVENIASTDSRIKPIYHNKNKGTMIARETGYKNATGYYLMFVDSDDTLPNNALEILYKEISQSGMDIILSDYQYVGEKKYIKEKKHIHITGEFLPYEFFIMHLEGKLRHNLWSCIFSAELFKREYTCLQNQTNGEDLILFYELVGNSKKIKSIDSVTYYYHVEGSSSTRSPMTVNKHKQIIKVLNFEYRYLSSMGISEELILKNIIPLVVLQCRYPKGIECTQDLDYRIKTKLGIFSSYKYLKLKNLIIYILVKKSILCSYIIKRLFYHYK